MKINATLDATISISKDIARVGISTAYLDAEKSVLVSTDGHRMTVLPVVLDEGDTSGRVSTVALEQALAVGKAAQKAIKLERGHKRRKAEEARRNVMARVEAWPDTGPDAAAKFGPWEAVVPKHVEPITIGLNARYLLELARALGSTDDVVYLDIETSGPCADQAAIRVTGHSTVPGAYAVLMPCIK